MPALIIVILWFAAAGGAQINNWLGASPRSALAVERRLFGLASGLTLLAYLLLLLGVSGHLSTVPILAACAVLGLIGLTEHKNIAFDLFGSPSCLRKSIGGAACTILLIIYGAAAIVGCFAPPTSIEWDSLSYHLADPKIYLAHHRIVYLPWESHSNFAFTMEMLYTVGLSLHSEPLAKLFHFTMGAISVGTVYLIGRRAYSPAVGLLGAVLFASLPLVFWEAGTAYVDLGATAFGCLSLLALIPALAEDDPEPAWLRASTVMMACMVSVKATSLTTCALFAAAILIVRYLKTKDFSSAFRGAAFYAFLSVLGGCVWYAKSWIVTGNPFFPFGYSLFGGRHWSASNAIGYAQSQAAFGAGHRFSDLLLAPWNLVYYLLPRTALPAAVTRPFNDFQTYLASMSAIFPAALFLPAFLKRKTPPIILALALYGLASFVVWFFLTQQVRYLLPVMPIYCVLSAYVVTALWKSRLITKTALGALTAVSLVFSASIAVLLIRQDLPVAAGLISRKAYLTSHLDCYAAMEYLNTKTPRGDGVVFYGEPRDYYCDRPYMWGEPGHGIVIPYDSMSSPDDLRNWLTARGYHYIFINYSQAKIGPDPGMNGLIYSLTAGGPYPPVYADRQIAIYDLP